MKKVCSKTIQRLKGVVALIEQSPLNFSTWFISFLAIMATRFFFESLFVGFENKSIEVVVGSFFQGTLLFFLFSFVLHLIFLKIVLKEQISKLANVVLWGQWLAVLPPIVDKLIFGDREIWSFYIFDTLGGLVHRYFTFFGANPDFGITWGVRVEVFIATIFLGVYVYLKKKKTIWLFGGVLGAYSLLFFLGVIPSALTYFVEMFQGTNPLLVQKRDVVSLFLTPLRYFGVERGDIKTALLFKMSTFYNLFLFVELAVLLYLTSKEKFFALLKNIRYPQMFFNSGLLFLGVGLGAYYFSKNFSADLFSVLIILNLWLAVFCAWFFSVLVNDLADVSIDKISNKNRPLVKETFSVAEYKELAIIFCLLALLSGFIVGVKFLLIVLLYLLLTWVYSQKPFHLKRFVLISSVISSFASLLFLIVGFVLVADNQALSFFPWRIVVFLFFVYALLIPTKDLKDVEGDRSAGISTLPTIFGIKNTRLFLGVILFLSYFGSVIVLNEKKLFLPAVLLGVINYYIITNEKYKAHSLSWWMLGLGLVYGIILVLITFG